MVLTTKQNYALLAKHGVYAREICDKCGAVLGAIRFTRKDESGVWCGRECRGDGEHRRIRKGGRPRKYETLKECRTAKTSQQRSYRAVSVWKKPPCMVAKTKDVQTQKWPLSTTPL